MKFIFFMNCFFGSYQPKVTLNNYIDHKLDINGTLKRSFYSVLKSLSKHKRKLQKSSKKD